MMKIDAPKGSLHVVVHEHQVQEMCRQGYRIIAVLEAEQTDFVPRSEDVWVDAPGYSRKESIQKQLPVTARAPLFLMEKDADSALAESTEKNSSLEAALRQYSKARDEDAKELASITTKYDRAVKDATQEREHCREVVAQLNAVRTVKNRLEEDMAKIRQAVGELRMKEILGASS